jgi:hypothetical protein
LLQADSNQPGGCFKKAAMAAFFIFQIDMPQCRTIYTWWNQVVNALSACFMGLYMCPMRVPDALFAAQYPPTKLSNKTTS